MVTKHSTTGDETTKKEDPLAELQKVVEDLQAQVAELQNPSAAARQATRAARAEKK